MIRLFVCTLFLSGAALAQTPDLQAPDSASVSILPPGVACTYEACALRVEPRLFSGPVVLRGRNEVPLGRVGLFSDALSRAVADNEVAYGYARDAEAKQGLGTAMAVIGAAVFTLSSTFLQVNRAFDDLEGVRTNDAAAVATIVGGAAVGIAGGVIALQGRQAESRAVWEYNRGLVPAP